MRLNNVLNFRDMRRYTKNPLEVKFEELLPLKLKNKVSGKGDRSKERVCVHEMSIMFACFKKNEFDESRCSSEINKFEACVNRSHADKFKRKQDLKEGNISLSKDNLSPREINYLLKKNPNP